MSGLPPGSENPPFWQRADEAAKDAEQKMEEFKPRMDPPTHTFFNERKDKHPTFEERAEMASQKAQNIAREVKEDMEGPSS